MVLVSRRITWYRFACSMCPYCSPALNDLGPRPPPITAYRSRDCGNYRAYTVIWGTFRRPRKRRAVSSVGLERLLTSRRSSLRVWARQPIFSVIYRIYHLVPMRMCHLYVSSEVGPEWPPLAPGDCGKVARFSLYPLICAHLRVLSCYADARTGGCPSRS